MRKTFPSNGRCPEARCLVTPVTPVVAGWSCSLGRSLRTEWLNTSLRRSLVSGGVVHYLNFCPLAGKLDLSGTGTTVSLFTTKDSGGDSDTKFKVGMRTDDPTTVSAVFDGLVGFKFNARGAPGPVYWPRQTAVLALEAKS